MPKQELRQEFSGEVARLFAEDIQYQRSRYYYFLGGVEPWTGVVNPDNGTDEENATLTESCEVNRRYRSEMVFVKKISPNDVSLVTKRIEWVSGTVYDQYDHTMDMRDKNFYVVTDDRAVYKCLNNSAGKPSLTKPEGNSITPITIVESDAGQTWTYVWKYMYTISAFKDTRFGTNIHLPVQRALSDSFYNNGSIDEVVVVQPGSGYTSDQATRIVVATDTVTGAGASGTVAISGTAVTGVTMDYFGSGYTAGVKVEFLSASGVGAEATAVIAGRVTDIPTTVEYSVVSGYTVSGFLDGYGLSSYSGFSGASGVTGFSGGFGYASGVIITLGEPDLNASGYSGVQATAYATIGSSGEISGFVVTNEGTGYTSAPAVTILPNVITSVDVDYKGSGYVSGWAFAVVDGPGLSGYNPATVLVASSGVSGEVVEITVDDAGSGYSTAPAISIFPNKVNSFSVLNGFSGTGYSGGGLTQIYLSAPDFAPGVQATATPVVTGGFVSGVTLTNAGSGYSGAPTILVTTSLIDINITNPGSGYVSPVVEITGGQVPGATPATATAQIDGNGIITGITITEPGNGYSGLILVSVTEEGFAGIDAVLDPVYGTGASGYVDIGSGASGIVVVGSGASAVSEVIVDQVFAVEISDGGLIYGEDTTVDFTVGGARLLPAVDANGTIIDVKILDGGAGYETAPALTVIEVPPGSGYGLYDNPTAVLEPVINNGVIVQVNILDPGIWYASESSTQINIQPDVTNPAKLIPIVDNETGQLVDVVVENSGENYDDVILTVAGAGSGATVQAVIATSDYLSDQAVIEQSPSIGSIFAIVVTEGGSNYTEQTVVAISGTGTGATAQVVRNVDTGAIERIDMITVGNGYTTADVHIVDNGRLYVPPEEAASAYAILPPEKGHGVNAPIELFASEVAINTSLRSEFEQYDFTQNFRHFGILKNPTSLLTGGFYRKPSGFTTYEIEFYEWTFNPIVDEILTLANQNRYRVIDFDANSRTMSLLPLDKDTASPLGILNSSPSLGTVREYTTLRVVTPMEVDKYSGRLLYISAENPFVVSEEQSITIKTFIKF